MVDKKWMTDKKAALPGLPPPEEDEVLVFESSAVTETQNPDREPEDRHLAHNASDDEEDGKSPETLSPNECILISISRRDTVGERALSFR